MKIKFEFGNLFQNHGLKCKFGEKNMRRKTTKLINKNEMHISFFFSEKKIGSNAYKHLIKIEINLCMKKEYLISNIERYYVTMNILLQPLFTLFVDSVMKTLPMSTTSSLTGKHCTVKMLTQNQHNEAEFC